MCQCRKDWRSCFNCELPDCDFEGVTGWERQQAERRDRQAIVSAGLDYRTPEQTRMAQRYQKRKEQARQYYQEHKQQARRYYQEHKQQARQRYQARRDELKDAALARYYRLKNARKGD